MQTFWYLALSSTLALSAYVLGRNHGTYHGVLKGLNMYQTGVHTLRKAGAILFSEDAKAIAKKAGLEHFFANSVAAPQDSQITSVKL